MHDVVPEEQSPAEETPPSGWAVPPTDPIAEAVPTWSDPVFPANGDAPPDILLGELLLMYFEWMGTHKETDASAKAVYGLLSTLLPADANGGSWGTARKMLQAIYDRTVKTVELCPNDCIAFYDCTHPKMKHYKHAHRTWCPCCGADRKLTAADGSVRAAKTGYYLPCGTWFRDLYKVDGLSEELSQDAAAHRPPGHTTRSRGWNQKVWDTNKHASMLCMLTYSYTLYKYVCFCVMHVNLFLHVILIRMLV
jgi:hypothetical protein